MTASTHVQRVAGCSSVVETPLEIFMRLNAEFRFTLDVCATRENAKCERYFTPEIDGLSQHWEGVCWMNPPYGPELERWVQKAFEESQRGATVVCLVPARTDTSWWRDFASKAEVRFIRKRLKFVGMPTNAPFPSAILIFRHRWWEER